jgi:D-alanyl-lipoteichoic acid acyltransferase DltB (MBOAT superfamily)
VKPVLEKWSLGGRKVYTFLVAIFANAMWALYSVRHHPKNNLFFYGNLVGAVLQLFYIIIYICFATGKKCILFVYLAIITLIVVCLGMVKLVDTHRWGLPSVAVTASVAGVIMQVAPVVELLVRTRAELKFRLL